MEEKKEIRIEVPRLVRHPTRMEYVFTSKLEANYHQSTDVGLQKCIFCQEEFPDGCCFVEKGNEKYMFPKIAIHYYSRHNIHPSQEFYGFVNRLG